MGVSVRALGKKLRVKESNLRYYLRKHPLKANAAPVAPIAKPKGAQVSNAFNPSLPQPTPAATEIGIVTKAIGAAQATAPTGSVPVVVPNAEPVAAGVTKAPSAPPAIVGVNPSCAPVSTG